MGVAQLTAPLQVTKHALIVVLSCMGLTLIMQAYLALECTRGN